MAASAAKCDTMFERASKSTLKTSIPIFCSIALSLTLLILSISQAFPIVKLEGADNSTMKQLKDTWNDACGNELIEYLSPFNFEESSFGINYGCGWRTRNTVFRCIIAFVTFTTATVSLLAVCANKCTSNWFGLYWLDWFCFVMMFVVFVLDCDSLNTGFRSCHKGFKVGDSDAIIYADGGSAIQVEQCYIAPFIFIPLLDIALSIMAYCAYKVSSYYILDSDVRKQTEQSVVSPATPATVSSTRSPSTIGGVQQTNPYEQKQSRAGSQVTQKKEDSPNPFEEYQGSYEVTTEQPPTQQIDMFNAYDEN